MESTRYIILLFGEDKIESKMVLCSGEVEFKGQIHGQNKQINDEIFINRGDMADGTALALCSITHGLYPFIY
jgi:hypothetical protein